MSDVAPLEVVGAPGAPDALASLHDLLDARLRVLFDCETRRWSRVDPSLLQPLAVMRSFVADGGKRIRPSFCFLGYLGSGGASDDPLVVELAAAVELLHAFALIHDDVMDGSARRRHAPAVHEQFGTLHDRSGWRGERRRFGEGMAILVGDLAFVYSRRLTSRLPGTVVEIFDEMCVELHMGQYLDLLSAAAPGADVHRARTVMRYKAGAYSVQRPLLLGATLAAGTGGVEGERLELLGRFGLAVGEAFQLRDDLLGAVGDPTVTGKPIGDDFREGKATSLVLEAQRWAFEHGDRRDLAVLGGLGSSSLSDDDVVALQELLQRSGAVDSAERRISEIMVVAEAALQALRYADPVASALHELARRCAWRSG